MTTTYAVVQHAAQQISIDRLESGKFVNQVSMWFPSRDAAKAELQRLCAADNVQAQSRYVLARKDVGL